MFLPPQTSRPYFVIPVRFVPLFSTQIESNLQFPPPLKLVFPSSHAPKRAVGPADRSLRFLSVRGSTVFISKTRDRAEEGPQVPSGPPPHMSSKSPTAILSVTAPPSPKSQASHRLSRACCGVPSSCIQQPSTPASHVPE